MSVAKFNDPFAVPVGTTPVMLFDLNPARGALRIQVLGSNAIYLGASNAVTATTGIQIPANGPLYEPLVADRQAVWACTATGSSDVRCQEGAH